MPDLKNQLIGMNYLSVAPDPDIALISTPVDLAEWGMFSADAEFQSLKECLTTDHFIHWRFKYED